MVVVIQGLVILFAGALEYLFVPALRGGAAASERKLRWSH